jgi:hypothetical protein
LSTLKDPQFAALVIGFVYAGLGGIAFAIGASSGKHKHSVPASQPLAAPKGPEDTYERMAVAFMTGFQSAKEFRR